MTTWADRQTSTPRDQQLLQQELAILDATEMVVTAMRLAGVKRSELALRLGKTKGWVTQILTGSANMTLRTLSEIMTAIGMEVRFGCACLSEDSRSINLFDDVAWGTPHGEIMYNVSVSPCPGNILQPANLAPLAEAV